MASLWYEHQKLRFSYKYLHVDLWLGGWVNKTDEGLFTHSEYDGIAHICTVQVFYLAFTYTVCCEQCVACAMP